MTPVEITGYLAALLIGASLGLVGGGGSILTVPVLVYLLGINPMVSTAYSLFVVGLTSLVGSAAYIRKGLVSFRTALVFAIPSVISVFFTRTFLVPAIPDVLIKTADFNFPKELFIMLLFALIMGLAAYSMIHQVQDKLAANEKHENKPIGYPNLWMLGTIMGVVTGTVGAGGGFLIIPVLVTFARLDMKMAIGTSLFIIAINSLIGFTGDMTHLTIDWVFLGTFSAMAIFGILIGSYLSGFVSSARLKPAFGWFVLIMGCFILFKELFMFPGFNELLLSLFPIRQ